MQPNTLTMLTALLGVVIGTAGFVISLLNYFRDRPKVIVFLGWDYVVTSDPDLKKDVGRGDSNQCGAAAYFCQPRQFGLPEYNNAGSDNGQR
jgi:hypothetical protein